MLTLAEASQGGKPLLVANWLRLGLPEVELDQQPGLFAGRQLERRLFLLRMLKRTLKRARPSEPQLVSIETPSCLCMTPPPDLRERLIRNCLKTLRIQPGPPWRICASFRLQKRMKMLLRRQNTWF